MVADDPESFADLDGHSRYANDYYNGGCVLCATEQNTADANTPPPPTQPPPQTPPPQKQHRHHRHRSHKPKPVNRKPGTKPARVIFNETSGLRPGSNNPEDLHDARVSIADTLLNAAGMRHPPRTVGDTLTTSAARAIGRDPDAMAAWADSQAAATEAAATPDNTGGATHFWLDYGQPNPGWALEENETAAYGPFTNVAGGGDVPSGATVTVRFYTVPQ